MKTTASRNARVLLAPFGTRGDVQPLVALGCELRRRGHDVRMAAPRGFENWLAELGFGPVAVVDLDLTRELERFYAAGQKPGALVRGIATMTDAQFRDLMPLTGPFDVVVGSGLQCAGPSLAERHGVPYTWLTPCPVTLRSRNHPPAGVRSMRLPRWVNALAWWGLSVIANRALRPIFNEHRAKWELGPVGDFQRHIMEPGRTLLACDDQLGQHCDDFSEGVEPTGFLFLDSPGSATLPAPVARFVERERAASRPLVYLGMGSTPLPGQTSLADLGRALAGELGASVVVGGGETVTEAGAHCLVVDFAPHVELFPHMDLVVHHGGSGTLSEAARAGVPQLVLPHSLDQFYWAHRVATLGLGPRGVRFSRATPRRVASRVKRAIGDGEDARGYRNAAERLAGTLRESRGVDRAADAVGALLPPQGG